MFYLRIIIAVIRTCHDAPRLIANRILHRMGLGFLAPSVTLITLRNGMRFTTGSSKKLGGSDLFLIWEIWTKHSYFLEEKEDFKIHPGDTVLDVGANRGYFTCFASKQVENGRVFSFEPSPASFKLLTTNLQLNNIKNVTAESKAVSSSEKTVDLFLSPGDDAGNSLYIKSDSKVSVPTVELASYSQQHAIERIDFLKIDCEGEEYVIFPALPNSFWDIVDKISMEYHCIDGKDPAELVQILKDKNFQIFEFSDKYIKAKKNTSL